MVTLISASVLSLQLWAQQTGGDVVVDYNNPKKYIVGGVRVEGNTYFAPEQILQITGLQEGMEVTVPSEEMSAIVNRLWMQRYFEDVAVAIDSIAPGRDTAFFKVSIIERPRLYISLDCCNLPQRHYRPAAEPRASPTPPAGAKGRLFCILSLR